MLSTSALASIVVIEGLYSVMDSNGGLDGGGDLLLVDIASGAMSQAPFLEPKFTLRNTVWTTTSSRINARMENGLLAGGNGYVGFRFQDDGNFFYGWAELTVGSTLEGFMLERWAFDNTDASIAVGQVPAPGPAGIAASRWGRRASGARAASKPPALEMMGQP